MLAWQTREQAHAIPGLDRLRVGTLISVSLSLVSIGVKRGVADWVGCEVLEGASRQGIVWWALPITVRGRKGDGNALRRSGGPRAAVLA
jgi:hypothetical protein